MSDHHANLRRREFAAGSAGSASLAGWSRGPKPQPAALVSILRARAYTAELFDAVRRLRLLHKLDFRGTRRAQVEFDTSTTINNPMVVHAAL